MAKLSPMSLSNNSNVDVATVALVLIPV